jgi:aminoglycoside phosphotransferase (APT) family kinase protein
VNVDWRHLGALAAATTDVARDPAVPMRERFTEVGELTAQLGMPDRSAELLNVWYIPGRSLQAVYRLTPGDDVLRVRFLPPEGPPPPLAPPGTVTLDEWSALGWWFPTDPALPELALLGEPGALDERVGQVVASRVLSYLPGERCALRVRTAERGELAVKVERPAETSAAAAALDRLWHAPQRAFGMPEPVGVDEAAGLRWERFVAGERLDADLSETGLRRLLPVVARDLGALHRLDDAALEPLGPPHVLDRIERKVLPRIDAALPALSDRARELVAALAATAPSADAGALAALHGDLHTANVLAGGDGAVTFLDLDRRAHGHAAFDLALLAGRLLLVAHSRGADVAPVAAAVAELPRGYAAATGIEMSDGDFAWYMAAHLLGRQLRTCIRHWVPGVALLAPTLLDWAATTVARGRFDARVVER